MLVQIQIENERQWREALEIIKKNILNIQERVETLQIYGPKLLKEAEKQKKRDQNSLMTQTLKKTGDALDEEVVGILKEVVKALIDYQTHDQKFTLKQFKQFELRKNQRVRIEDVLQVFIDHHDHLTEFIKFVIEEFQKLHELNDGGIGARSIQSLTQINLYHRLLECYLYRQQSIETEIKNKQREQDGKIMTQTTTMPKYTFESQNEQATTAERMRKVKEQINNLIEKYDR